MKTETWILIVLAVAVVGLFVFKPFGLGGGGLGKATGNAVSGAGGAVDTSGWTDNEKMNYEMHGTLPARVQGSGIAASSSGMIGGC